CPCFLTDPDCAPDGMIAQMGEPPPCKREMRVRVPLVPPFPGWRPEPGSVSRVGLVDRERLSIPVLARRASMCDYSLHCVASRPAKVGDKLTTTSFSGTSTRGFAAVGEPNVAVCLLPGTEVVFEREAEYEHAFRRLLPGLRLGRLGHSVA